MNLLKSRLMKLYSIKKCVRTRIFMSAWSFIFLMFLSLIFQACAQRPSYTSPHHYNFKEGEKYFLPESLTEVSGISFLSPKSGQCLCCSG